MTGIPAEVVAAHRLVNQYHVIVRIGAAHYRGSFATLVFGDDKPLIGACHDRRVDLIYRTLCGTTVSVVVDSIIGPSQCVLLEYLTVIAR
jgi:hypothetical protein